MKCGGTLRTIALAAMLAFIAAGAEAQTTTRHSYDAHGREIGRTESRPDGSARYYSPTGRETGRSEMQRDGSTRFYDEHGREVGTVR